MVSEAEGENFYPSLEVDMLSDVTSFVLVQSKQKSDPQTRAKIETKLILRLAVMST